MPTRFLNLEIIRLVCLPGTTACVVLAVEWGRRTGISVPIPFLLLYVSVVVSGGLAGKLAGAVSGALASLFVIYSAAIGFGPPTLTGGPVQVFIGVLLYSGTGLLLGNISDLRNQILKENQRYKAKLESEILARIDELQISEQRFRDIAESSSDWFWEMDEDLRYTYLSDRYEENTELKIADRIGTRSWDFAHPSDISEKWAAHQADMEARRPFKNFEYASSAVADDIVFLSTSGVPVFDADGEFMGYRGSTTDITERKQAETALRESEERFRAAFESSPVGNIAISDDGIIEAFNPVAENMFGYAADEVVGQNVSMLMPAPDRNNHDDYIRRYLETGEAKIIGIGRDVTGLRKNGEEFPMHLRIGEIHARGRRSFIGSVTDLTEMKSLEQQLRQSQKMEAVGQLTGGIAHDFNNMLGVIMGNLDLLRRKVAGDPKAMERVEAAYGSAERGANITRKLLSFSREDVGNTQLTNVNEFIEGMENLVARSLTPKITVETHLADDIWAVNIDPRDFEDALLNLSLNARDAMPDGGSLMIEAANRTLDEHYVRHNPGSTTGEHVMVSVSDTGTGMTPDVVEKAFQPFFSTKNEAQGTGLGLSMVYGFVQRSGGHIKIYSEPGRGTTFHIYFPRATEGTDGTEPANAVADGELPRGDETVLVVDDEENLLKVAVSYLEDLGYRTLTAVNGRQALEVLQEQRQIDLLFSDVVMSGGMDGYDLAIEALKNRPGLKVLLTSGFTARRERIANGDTSLFKKLSNNLLSKPYNQPQLAAAVRRALDEEG